MAVDNIKCPECGDTMKWTDQPEPWFSIRLPFIGQIDVYRWVAVQYCPTCTMADEYDQDEDIRERIGYAYEEGLRDASRGEGFF